MRSSKIRKWRATHQRVRILFWLFHHLLISLYETWWSQEINDSDIKIGHSCMDPLIHSRVPFHFAAAWFPKKEICKGIEISNRCEIKTKLLTFPTAAQSWTLALQCTLLANVTHNLYEINDLLYQINWRMRERSRGLLYRGNIKPQTFEIAEIKFGNFLGQPRTIQNRTEVMQSEKEKSGAMLFKTNR